MQQFSIGVGTTADVNRHQECAYHQNEVAAGLSVTLNCQAQGQFVSFKRRGGREIHLVIICEFVVIGHPMKSRGKHLSFFPADP